MPQSHKESIPWGSRSTSLFHQDSGERDGRPRLGRPWRKIRLQLLTPTNDYLPLYCPKDFSWVLEESPVSSCFPLGLGSSPVRTQVSSRGRRVEKGVGHTVNLTFRTCSPFFPRYQGRTSGGTVFRS